MFFPLLTAAFFFVNGIVAGCRTDFTLLVMWYVGITLLTAGYVIGFLFRILKSAWFGG